MQYTLLKYCTVLLLCTLMQYCTHSWCIAAILVVLKSDSSCYVARISHSWAELSRRVWFVELSFGVNFFSSKPDFFQSEVLLFSVWDDAIVAGGHQARMCSNSLCISKVEGLAVSGANVASVHCFYDVFTCCCHIVPVSLVDCHDGLSYWWAILAKSNFRRES